MVRETEEKYQWLADNVPVGIAEMRYDGIGLKIEYANRELYHILRCTEQEYEEKYDNYYNAVVKSSDWERMHAELKRCCEEWTQLEMEYRVYMADGRTGWRIMHAVPMKWENGTWFQCSVSDITRLKEAEMRYDSLMENFPGCIIRVFYYRNQVTLEYVSEGITKLTGYEIEEYKNYFHYFANQVNSDKEAVKGLEFVRAARVYGKGIRKEYSFSDKNGNVRWIEVRSSIAAMAEESMVIQYVLFDINEQKQAEESAKKERERLEVVADLSTDAVFEYDISKDCMRYYNRKDLVIDAERNLPVIERYTRRIMNGSIVNELFHPDDTKQLEELCLAFRSGQARIYTEVRKQYEKGRYSWVSVEARTMFDKNGRPSHIIGKISNIDDRIRRENELRSRSERDSMTGLYNTQTIRRRIAERLAKENETDAYVVVTDIDNFKTLNDSMGHLFGDAILCTFAEALTEQFPEAMIGRSGADEYLFYLENIPGNEILERIETLNRNLSRIRPGESELAKVSASFGFAKCEKGKKNSLEKLEKQAEAALLYLKISSRGSAMLYDEKMADLRVDKEQKEISREKREAVIQNEGDLILFAHELFENVKDIKGVLRIMADSITRFFQFQDILYVRRENSSAMRLRFHWGEKDITQFYDDISDISSERDWKRLLYTDRSKEYVVLTEDDFIGENLHKAKSMISFRVGEGEEEGYCICVDRREMRDWKAEAPTLMRLGEFLVRPFFAQKLISY